MKVYQALAQAFVAEGTKGVFGMMGDANQYWIDALDSLGVPTYGVRHEAAGPSMASGWARVTGEPGVCTTTCGPGTTQIATTLTAASRGQIPLVAFCGDGPWGNDDYVQRLDQQRFAAATESRFVRMAKPSQAFEAVQKAFYIARTESMPVLLSVPMDLQQAEFDASELYSPSSTLISGGSAAPAADRIAHAADLIRRAKKVVIVVGRGAVAAAADEATLELANRLGALVVTSLNALTWLADRYEMHGGVSGYYAAKNTIGLYRQADCLIGIGTSLDTYTLRHHVPGIDVIHIDRAAEIVIAGNRRATCHVQADANIGVAALNSALAARSIQHEGYRTAAVQDELATALADPTAYELEPNTLDPRDVARIIDETIPAEIPLVAGSGHYSHFAVMLARRARPFTIINKDFGSIGLSLNTAIGAAIGTGKPLVCLDGDAGFMMHLAEFDTAVRYSLPLLVAVFNDEALGSELHKADIKKMNVALARVASPNLGSVAVALGGKGAQIRTAPDLRTMLNEYVENPAPTVLDIRVSSNVKSIPTRRGIGLDV